jgi:dienelactone hydrolase
MEDTTAIFKSLLTRKDLDFSKILLAGFSRGGFLSLSLAMQKFPGAVAVINFSGGWVGETCSGGMINTEGFKKFGQEVKIPTISFYGENDNYYSISHIRTNLEYLAKNQISESHTLPGGNHVILSKKEFWWPLAEKWLDEKVFPKAAQ